MAAYIGLTNRMNTHVGDGFNMRPWALYPSSIFGPVSLLEIVFSLTPQCLKL